MQFIPHGPDIPDSLMRSHEEGRLVFFCGAGISYRAGLKDFKWLTHQLYKRNDIKPDAIQSRALKEKRYDTAIQLLEADVDIRSEVRRELVRSKLSGILCPDANLPGYVDTHAALLTLAGDRDDPNRIRLVTTNFDRVFEIALSSGEIRPKSYRAPFLPRPDNQWDGLVYLHGLLSESSTKEDLENLVISSGDFGTAYLTERWASRFVSELFRRYDICFVGYSLEDPVLRYITDALAADQWRGEVKPSIYAFAACAYKNGKGGEVANDWKAKGVVPILYEQSDNHAALHDTLAAWAKCYRDGLEGKIAIINRYAGLNPTECIPEDDFVGRVIWALSDPSGKPARHFANRSEPPPLTWLAAMEHRDIEARRKESGKTSDTSIFRRPPAGDMLAALRIAHVGGALHLPFDAVASALGQWLIRHLDNPDLLLWVAGRGGKMHPDWARGIEWRLRELQEQKQPNRSGDESTSIENRIKIRPAMETLWRLVLEDKLAHSLQRLDFHDWFEELSRTGISPILRWRLRNLLAPHFTLRPPWNFHGNENPIPSEQIISPNDLFSLEIVLGIDFVTDTIRSHKKIPAWKIALPSLADEFTGLLHDCCELMVLLGMENSYKVRWEISSIENSSQNQHLDDWTTLVFLARDAWERIHEESPSRAIDVAKAWWGKPFSLFKRLAFHAAANSPQMPPEIILNWLAEDDARWLWESDCRHERIRLFEILPTRWEVSKIRKLEALILAEPVSRHFPQIVEEGELRQRIDRLRRFHFVSLKTNGLELGQKSLECLADIFRRNPALEEPISESQKFCFDRGFQKEAANWISKPKRTKPERLGEFLSKHSEDTRIRRAWRRLGKRMQHCEQLFAPESISNTAHALLQVAKGAPGQETLLRDLCFRILDTQEKPPHSIPDDMLSSAINSAKGRATEALLIQWGNSGPQKNQGLPDYLKKSFTSIATQSQPYFQEARCILCSRLVFFFQVDPEWTTQRLIPLFDWSVSEPEAKAAWEGFLWSPRLYRPLLEKMKPSFLETVNHYDKISPDLRDEYATLLTHVALDRRGVFTEAALRKAFSALPESGLLKSLQCLIWIMKDDPAHAATLWKNRVIPLLAKVWPWGRLWREEESEYQSKLTELCLATGDAFPDAVKRLSPRLKLDNMPGLHLYGLAHDEKESIYCEKFPEDVLHLLFVIIAPEKIKYQWPYLKICLEKISQAQPELCKSPKYIKLHRMLP